MQHERKLRSRQRAKIDQRIGDPQLATDQSRPGRATNSTSSVCTRQNGSPNQSHSCPLLSTTSQQTIVTLSRHRPSVSKGWRCRRGARRAPPRDTPDRRPRRWHMSERQQADRHVQVEDPAPAVVVGDVAAERRPDDRREQRRDAEERHRRALLLRRKGIEQNRPGSTAAVRRRPAPAARGPRSARSGSWPCRTAPTRA